MNCCLLDMSYLHNNSPYPKYDIYCLAEAMNFDGTGLFDFSPSVQPYNTHAYTSSNMAN